MPAFHRPLRRSTIEGIFGSIACPAGCGRFALWPRQNTIPPHLHPDSPPPKRVMTPEGPGIQALMCGASGQPFR